MCSKNTKLATILGLTHTKVPYLSWFSKRLPRVARLLAYLTLTMTAAEPLSKLPLRRPPGLNPKRRRSGARSTTSSVEFTTVFRRASPLCIAVAPPDCVPLQSAPLPPNDDHLRSAEALAAKPLFGNHRIGPPGKWSGRRFCNMAVFAALQPPFRAEHELDEPVETMAVEPLALLFH